MKALIVHSPKNYHRRSCVSNVKVAKPRPESFVACMTYRYRDQVVTIQSSQADGPDPYCPSCENDYHANRVPDLNIDKNGG